MTVSAERLLQHIPSHQVGWCYWVPEQAVKPAPLTGEELGDFYRRLNDWDGCDNGFKEEYPPSGLEGLRAAQAQGREVYLILPGSLINEDDRCREKSRKWKRVREEIPFLMKAEEWDCERAYSWTVISLKAQLSQDQFDRLVRLIKEELS